MTAPDKPDQDEGGFLGRWSRRKLMPEPELPVVPPVATAQPAEPDDRPRDPETGELIDEELVSHLPKVEELQAGGDLSVFMQKGVPESLRREALRTMWLNDPMIRNYVSPALDYAYDYNAPGGAPGYGPLTESDMAQARDFLANVFSTPQKTAIDPESADEMSNRDNQSHAEVRDHSVAVRLTDAAAQHEEVSDVAEDSTNAPEASVNDTKLPQTDNVLMVQRSMSDPEAPQGTISRRRRGGGAAPI